MLPLPLLWLAHPAPRSAAPAARSAGGRPASLLASAWWVVPLLLLGRYSLPVPRLHRDRRASRPSVTSVPNVLRGASRLARLLAESRRADAGRPGRGWLATDRWLCWPPPRSLALGLAGLTPRAAARNAASCCSAGCSARVVMAVGHAGVTGPLAGPVRGPARRAARRRCATCTRPSPCCACALALGAGPRAGGRSRPGACRVVPRSAGLGACPAPRSPFASPPARWWRSWWSRPRRRWAATSHLEPRSRRCPATGSAPRPGWTPIPSAGPCWSPGPRSVTTAGDTPTTSRWRRWHARRWLFATRFRSVRRAPRGCSTGSATSWPAAARPLGSRARWRGPASAGLLLRNDLDPRAPADPRGAVTRHARRLARPPPGGDFGPPPAAPTGLVGRPRGVAAGPTGSRDLGRRASALASASRRRRARRAPRSVAPRRPSDLAAAGWPARPTSAPYAAGSPGAGGRDRHPASSRRSTSARSRARRTVRRCRRRPPWRGAARPATSCRAGRGQTVARFVGGRPRSLVAERGRPDAPGWRGAGTRPAPPSTVTRPPPGSAPTTGGHGGSRCAGRGRTRSATLWSWPARRRGARRADGVRVATDAGSVPAARRDGRAIVVPRRRPDPPACGSSASPSGDRVRARSRSPRWPGSRSPSAWSCRATRGRRDRRPVLRRTPSRGRACLAAARGPAARGWPARGGRPDLASRPCTSPAAAGARCRPRCAAVPGPELDAALDAAAGLSRDRHRAGSSTTLRPGPERRSTATRDGLDRRRAGRRPERPP